MKDPWIKFYAGDFLHGVRDMNAEQIGAYMVVLAMMWDKGGPIEDDGRRIARRAGISVRRWGQIRDYLIAEEKLQIRNGMIGNPRAIAELRARAEKSELGRKAALARWDATQTELDLGEDYLREKPEKNQKKPRDKVADKNAENLPNPAENSQTGDADAFSPSRARATPELEARVLPQPNPESVTQASRLDDADLQALYDAVADATGHNPIQPAQISRAYSFIERWRTAGISFDDVVLPVIRDQLARSSDKVTRTLGRFDPFITAEQAARKAAKATGRDARPPDPPIVDLDDASPEINSIRRAFLEALGPITFARYLNPGGAVIEIIEPSDTASGKRVLRINERGLGRFNDGDRTPIIRRIAKAHGIDTVW